jgi:hypothetical protein
MRYSFFVDPSKSSPQTRERISRHSGRASGQPIACRREPRNSRTGRRLDCRDDTATRAGQVACRKAERLRDDRRGVTIWRGKVGSAETHRAGCGVLGPTFDSRLDRRGQRPLCTDSLRVGAFWQADWKYGYSYRVLFHGLPTVSKHPSSDFHKYRPLPDSATPA